MKRKIALIQILFVFIFVVSIIYITIYGIGKYKIDKETEYLRNLINESLSENSIETHEVNGMLSRYYELYKRNTDLAGWIRVQGTDIDYPVMYNGESNAFYLHRNFDKEESDAGIPFLDYQCNPNGSSTNMIVYGHNMRNGTMFHELLKYEDKAFEAENRYLKFDTMYFRRAYEIFAVFKTEVGREDEFKYYEFINAESEAQFNDYVNTCKERSIYETGVQPVYGESLLTLSTCSYSRNNERFVVVARMSKN